MNVIETLNFCNAVRQHIWRMVAGLTSQFISESSSIRIFLNWVFICSSYVTVKLAVFLSAWYIWHDEKITAAVYFV